MRGRPRKMTIAPAAGRRLVAGRIFGVLAFTVLLASSPADAQRQPLDDPSALQGEFLRAVAPLDEPRGLCIDIPGHRARVNVDAALVVHTCKWKIWNRDERFDRQALAKGDLRMPTYGLCLGVEAARDGAKIRLGNCDGAPLRRWTFVDQRLRLTAAMNMCLTIGPEPSELTPGGRRLPSRHVARSLGLAPCMGSASDRQLWQFVMPDR